MDSLQAGLVVPAESMAIVRCASGVQNPEAFARGVVQYAWGSARVLKSEPGEASVLWAEIPGGPAGVRAVVVKTRRVSGVGGRLRSMLRLGREMRHWRGAAWLDRHGFATAAPLLLLRGRDSAGAVETLVLEALEGPTLLEVMAGRARGVDVGEAGAERAVSRLAESVGRQVARLARLEHFNRDHKPSNLIVDESRLDVAIIDCVGIRHTRGNQDQALERMLASLVIEPLGVGVLPRRSILWRVVASVANEIEPSPSLRLKVMRALWRNVAARVRAHGDPRPVIDPLGSELAD